MVVGAWCLVLGAWCLVLGAWCGTDGQPGAKRVEERAKVAEGGGTATEVDGREGFAVRRLLAQAPDGLRERCNIRTALLGVRAGARMQGAIAAFAAAERKMDVEIVSQCHFLFEHDSPTHKRTSLGCECK